MTQTTTTPTQFWTVDEFNELLLSNINSMTPLQREQVLVYTADLNEALVANQDKHITLDTLTSLAAGARTLFLTTRATGTGINTAPTSGELNAALTAITGTASTYTPKQGDMAYARYIDAAARVEVWQYHGTAWVQSWRFRDGIDTSFVTVSQTVGLLQGLETSLIYDNATTGTLTLTADTGFTLHGTTTTGTFSSTFSATFHPSTNSITLPSKSAAQIYRRGTDLYVQFLYPQRMTSSSTTTGITVQDEGVAVGSGISTINVVGSGISITTSGTTATITLAAVPTTAGSQYLHLQNTAALTWTIVHGLSTTNIDSVNVYDSTGRKVYADIVVVNSATVTVSFSIAQSGYAVIES